MAKGNNILCGTDYKGRHIRVIVSGTPSPGTGMTLVVGTAVDGLGRFTWAAFNRDADGNRALLGILVNEQMEGKTATTAFAAGDEAYVYIPQPGDMVNVLTSAAVTRGDYLIRGDGDGLFETTTGTPESEPFQALETTAGAGLAWAICTGQ